MMNNKLNNNSKFTGEMYGTKVSVEYDHSDISFDEAMGAFETLLTGLGYHKDVLKEWVIERAEEYKEQDSRSEDDENQEIILNNGIDNEDQWPTYNESVVEHVINKLKQIEVDGDTMQYILEKVGLDEQLAIQLATSYPDLVEEHLDEIKDIFEPEISDNFQIGPEGAYEHNDDEYNDYIQSEFVKHLKQLKNRQNGK